MSYSLDKWLKNIYLGEPIEKYKQGDILIDFNKIGPIWQPAKINTQEVNNNLIDITNTYETIKERKEKIIKKRKISKLIMTLATIGSIILFFYTMIPHILIIIIFGIIQYYAFNIFVKSISKDLIKLQIAKENNWLYNPYKDQHSWIELRNKYKEIFDKGDENQNLEDQFWGKIKKDNKDYYFHTGLFFYDVVTKDSKGRRNKTTYQNHFFGVRLNKEINSRFYLYPESIFSKIGNFFTKKEINTQSIQFNKTFAFSYNGKKTEEGIKIIETLSPAVQNKLVKLKKKHKSVRVLFSGDSVYFIFNGLMMNDLETDLLKDDKISEKDKKAFNKKLNALIEISSDISKYLD